MKTENRFMDGLPGLFSAPEKRREAIRQAIKERGLSLNEKPNGHAEITGHGVRILVAGLEFLCLTDLS